ncbi:MAG: hypothetical protein LBG87_07895 [Spirochaetaceae bacterium]|nr:hypothetical protein [Spirochaetaceae bacterium]
MARGAWRVARGAWRVARGAWRKWRTGGKARSALVGKAFDEGLILRIRRV